MLALSLCWKCMAPADAIKAAQQSAKAEGIFGLVGSGAALKEKEIHNASVGTLLLDGS